MWHQIKKGIPFNINQSFLTTVHNIDTCSMLIPDIIFGITSRDGQSTKI